MHLAGESASTDRPQHYVRNNFGVCKQDTEVLQRHWHLPLPKTNKEFTLNLVLYE